MQSNSHCKCVCVASLSNSALTLHDYGQICFLNQFHFFQNLVTVA